MTKNLTDALRLFGEVIYADGLQAMIVSNNSLVERLYDLTNVNRDIDAAWVAEMKKEIVTSHEQGKLMQVTVGIDTRDVLSIIESHEKPEGEEPVNGGLRVKVYDGQHRLTAMAQLHRENPDKVYKFFAMVYLLESNDDEKLLLEKLNLRREFTSQDKVVVDARKSFLDVWEKLTTSEHQNRLCVRNIRSSQRIRCQPITEALSKMTPAMMEAKLYEIAASYHQEFLRACESNKFVRSVVHKVISETKLYQLVSYYFDKENPDAWLHRLV